MKYFRSGQYPVEIVISEHINKAFSSHSHTNHYIISLCIKGSVTATLEDKTLLFKENDFFVVSPLMPHAVSLSDTSVLLSVCMDKSMIEDSCPQKITEILEMVLLSSGIREKLTKQQNERLLQAIPCIYQLLFSHKKELEHDMSILCDKLTGNFSEPISLQQLAGDLYINKYHLIRKCRKSLGLTPHKFHLQNRIRKAQELLLTSSSITETSVNTGFYDQSHFDKSFKKIVGISPTEYLASCKSL